MHVSFLILADLDHNGPHVRMSLPLMRIGDNLSLRFTLERTRNGRRELLEVDGVYHVTSLTLDGSHGRFRQTLTVTATGIAPLWRAVKLAPKKRVALARSPRTPV